MLGGDATTSAACGAGDPTTGMNAPPVGATMGATNGGTTFQWPAPIAPDGKDFLMCWCGASSDCTKVSNYPFKVGTMSISGPVDNIAHTCTSGFKCSIPGLTGQGLQNQDLLMIQKNGCGSSGAAVQGFPNGGITTFGGNEGKEHSWKEVKITAPGAVYDICWCAKGQVCIEALHFRKRTGALTLIGPQDQAQSGLSVVCWVFGPCSWNSVVGEGLQDGDRMMVLKTCGEGKIVPGFPNNDLAIATNGGADYAFGDASAIITAGGDEYQICWCAKVNVCSQPASFLTKAGGLIVMGPQRDHAYACLSGSLCQITGFRGRGLVDGDKIKILDKCGEGVAEAGFPLNGIMTATNSGADYVSWTGNINVAVNRYRICWCRNHASWDCSTSAGFKADAGSLEVVSIDTSQNKNCHVSDGCRVTGLTGSRVRDGDLMKILTTCGQDTPVAGWPNGGVSQPASASGTTYSWGLTTRVLALPGDYKMCWCPAGHSNGCDDSVDFTFEVGTILLKGPRHLSRNETCSAYHDCNVEFNVGHGWTYGTDRVILIDSESDCRDTAPNPAIGNGEAGVVVGTQVDALVRFTPVMVPFGGLYKICYCANYDSAVDGDQIPCSSYQDYPATGGILTLNGAYGNQSFVCTRNQDCTFNVKGYGLDERTHHVAYRDETTTCGSKKTASGHPATAKVSDEEITFVVGKIQQLRNFTICYCAPPRGSNECSLNSLETYHQTVGILDVRGANPSQSFQCGRGGFCTIEITGYNLQGTDFIKIANQSTPCEGEPQPTGFFRALLMAEMKLTTDTKATFNVGRVDADGGREFKVCYCASLDNCDANHKYNHQAGTLLVLEPLASINLASTTATSLILSVEARISDGKSGIRCAASVTEQQSMPDASRITKGFGRFGVGAGASEAATQVGPNKVEVFFKVFVKAGEQYRVWCFDESAQSGILPPNSREGITMVTPEKLEVPRMRAFPSFLWRGASFYAELSRVFDEAVDRTQDPFVTKVRLSTGSGQTMCNKASYLEATPLQVSYAGEEGVPDVILISQIPLNASDARPCLCFFSSPTAQGIAMLSDQLTVSKDAPSFTQTLQTGQVTTKFYRGMKTQVLLENHNTGNKGLLHWTLSALYKVQGCSAVSRVPPTAKMVNIGGKKGNTTFFRNDDPPGMYTMCYLGKNVESTTIAPFNGIGEFELMDTVTQIGQSPHLPSTRDALRLELEIRMPGEVECLVKPTAAGSSYTDFIEEQLFEGRASISVDPLPEGYDPEFPRLFNLIIPLVKYQKTAGPLHIWCRHSRAELLVLPGTKEGTLIGLETMEPSASPMPTWIWDGAYITLVLENTPSIPTKLVSLHEPKMPEGWERVIEINNGSRTIRYKNAEGTVEEDHPALTLWFKSEGPDPCVDANESKAQPVSERGYVQTKARFNVSVVKPFVCYWSAPAAYPHTIGVLDVRAQPPKYILEVNGEDLGFVYRGVDATMRVIHTSDSLGTGNGGKIFVITEEQYEEFGGACEDITEKEEERRRLQADIATTTPKPTAPPGEARPLTVACIAPQKKTAEFQVLPAETLFPELVWQGPTMEDGMNCSKDFELFLNEPALVNTSILADQKSKTYVLATSNLTMLLHLVPNIRGITPDSELPTQNVVIVDKAFTNLKNKTWIFKTEECKVQALLSIASPMFREGAEFLPLSQYLEAKLDLVGFEFVAIMYTPIWKVTTQKDVCGIVQPLPEAPIRAETVFDIDKPGLGRTIRDGIVSVPALSNGTGTFLHTNELGKYIMCYLGNTNDKPAHFNPIGDPFEAKDVLPVDNFQVPLRPESNTLQVYLNITSQIRGIVRCAAFLRNTDPPLLPDDVFYPNVDHADFLGASGLVKYDLARTSQIISLPLDQEKAGFIAPSATYAKAPPSTFVWCAHEVSTILYPKSELGFALDLKARPPPAFIYVMWNKTITYLLLTRSLPATPCFPMFADWRFPVNEYDRVEFSSKTKMPKGLEIDKNTGIISGIPEEERRWNVTIFCKSVNPPAMTNYTNIVIEVQDVLSLQSRHVSVETAVYSIEPRVTSTFEPQEVYFLTKPKLKSFSGKADFKLCFDLLTDIPFRNDSTFVTCKMTGSGCCCGSFVLVHLLTQDIRTTHEVCSMEPGKEYHTKAVVKGMKKDVQGTVVEAVLQSARKVDLIIPEEQENKAPVEFNVAVDMQWSEYSSNKAMYDEMFIEEIMQIIFIPKELVKITKVEEGSVVFFIMFYLENKCMQDVSTEQSMLSGNIDVRAGCSRVAPREYKEELQSHIEDATSSIYFNPKFVLLKKVIQGMSFTIDRTLHFCKKEPLSFLWEYGAVVEDESQCPYDLMKFIGIMAVGGTIGLHVFAMIVCHLSKEFARFSFLYKTRVLDILTSVLAVYATLGQYFWLFQLKIALVHEMHDTLFLIGAAHMFLCFCINTLALRIVLTTYIVDTPWWRKNKKHMKFILFFTALAPRFLRVTRCNLFNIDTTHIHFGTPSKMAVVFSNLGMVMLLQDIPQFLLNFYVWYIWQNEGPRVSLITAFLSFASILVAATHHVFSRSQRAAYERVVKLLGVRRLTAGFFDVATGVGQSGQGGIQAITDQMRRADDGEIDLGDNDNEFDEGVDPSMLDPIQAAMYVSQMYERDQRAIGDGDDDGGSQGSGSDEGSGSEQSGSQKGAGKKTLYPKALYDKVKKFYEKHDPQKLDGIGVDEDAKVDEAAVNDELRKTFGVGLEDVA